MDELFTPFGLASENLRTADAAALVVAACGKGGASPPLLKKQFHQSLFESCRDSLIESRSF
jgi:hypothetical protein